jgi:hypothetical protein
MDRSKQDSIEKARMLVTAASEASRALERAQQAVDDLLDSRVALEEIAAIAYGIDRSLTRATIAAEGIIDDLRDAADSAEELARRR